MMTIKQRSALHEHNSKCHDNCPRKHKDELLDAIRGSALWEVLQTPMSKLIDQLRETNKQ